MSTPINIQLDNTTPVNYRNLRQGNAFMFNFTILINGLPADASAMVFTITINGPQKLVISDNEITKVGNNIYIEWDSFPLLPGHYTYSVDYVLGGKKQTIIPGTIQIIRKDA